MAQQHQAILGIIIIWLRGADNSVSSGAALSKGLKDEAKSDLATPISVSGEGRGSRCYPHSPKQSHTRVSLKEQRVKCIAA